MDIIQFADFAPQAIINLILLGGGVYLFRTFLPRLRKDHAERVDELIKGFSGDLQAERELHKSVQQKTLDGFVQLNDEIRRLDKQLSRLSSILTAQITDDPDKASRIIDLLMNGEPDSD